MFPLFRTLFDGKNAGNNCSSSFKFLSGKKMKGVSVFLGKLDRIWIAKEGWDGLGSRCGMWDELVHKSLNFQLSRSGCGPSVRKRGERGEEG